MNHADDRKLAPHVDPAWAESMLIELRLQGVAGNDIGAALSEVESHCAEAGVSARDSFGDPVEYARSLGLPVDPRQEAAAIGRTVGPLVLQVGGMLALLAALRGRDTGQVPIHVGDVVGFVAFLAGTALLVLASGRVLRALVTKPIFALGALTVTMGLLLVPAALRSVLGQVPAVPIVVVGTLLLLGGVALSWATDRGEPADPVASPLLEATATRARATSWIPLRLLVPAATVVMGAVILLLG